MVKIKNVATAVSRCFADYCTREACIFPSPQNNNNRLNKFTPNYKDWWRMLNPSPEANPNPNPNPNPNNLLSHQWHWTSWPGPASGVHGIGTLLHERIVSRQKPEQGLSTCYCFDTVDGHTRLIEGEANNRRLRNVSLAITMRGPFDGRAAAAAGTVDIAYINQSSTTAEGVWSYINLAPPSHSTRELLVSMNSKVVFDGFTLGPDSGFTLLHGLCAVVVVVRALAAATVRQQIDNLFNLRNGHIKRITDTDIQSSVLEIMGTNVSTTFIQCPADPKKTLGIKLPFLVMIIKNLRKYFTFEVMVLDDKNVRRRFRASNYQSTTRVKPFICTMPMRLDEGWNQIQFNLSDFTRRAYGTNYIETLRVQIHANCRIRRIYFSDRLYSEDELPPEFKLFLPITQQQNAAAAASQQVAPHEG
eukprot:scaffold5398_cov240-Ochromonas_danica.AAC.4